ncbi:MAG: nucleotidyltransferase family protein [Hyphomicrobium sp.]
MTAEPGASATISAVILAGGRSRRFAAGNKLLADIGGEPLLRRTARTVCAAGLRDIVVVTGYEHTAYAAALAGLPLHFLENPRWAEGIGTSIAAGIGSLSAGSRGAFIVPGDLPGLSVATLRRLMAVFDEWVGNRIVVPVESTAGKSGGREGGQRNPVLWPGRYYPLLATLDGETGGKHLLMQLASETVPVAIADERELLDVDTVEDLADVRCDSNGG